MVVLPLFVAFVPSAVLMVVCVAVLLSFCFVSVAPVDVVVVVLICTRF